MKLVSSLCARQPWGLWGPLTPKEKMWLTSKSPASGLEISSYLLCLTAATRSGPENMENKLSPLADDVSSLELAESPWVPDQPLCRLSLKTREKEAGSRPSVARGRDSPTVSPCSHYSRRAIFTLHLSSISMSQVSLLETLFQAIYIPQKKYKHLYPLEVWV